MFINKPINELIPLITSPNDVMFFNASKINLRLIGGEYFPIKAGFELPRKKQFILIVDSEKLPLAFAVKDNRVTYLGVLRKTVNIRLNRANQGGFFRFRSRHYRKLTGRELTAKTLDVYQENLITSV